MTTMSREILCPIHNWAKHSKRMLQTLMRNQTETGENNNFPDIYASLNRCETAVLDLLDKVEIIHESAHPAGDADSLNVGEIAHLLRLNEQLKQLSIQLGTFAKEINPRMKAKVADPGDPMFDYEVEAKIDFYLREDDPAWRDDEDNILASRSEYLKDSYDVDIECDFNDCPNRLGIFAHSHSWLFHDLYDHDYSIDAPALSFRDCLRIGQIFIDVEILQQYRVDIEEAAQNHHVSSSNMD